MGFVWNDGCFVSLYGIMIAKTLEVSNRLGLHARAAAKIVKTASEYTAQVKLEVEGQEVDAKSILDILTVACPQGSFVTVSAEGPDALEAVGAIEKLFAAKFGEE